MLQEQDTEAREAHSEGRGSPPPKKLQFWMFNKLEN